MKTTLMIIMTLYSVLGFGQATGVINYSGCQPYAQFYTPNWTGYTSCTLVESTGEVYNCSNGICNVPVNNQSYRSFHYVYNSNGVITIGNTFYYAGTLSIFAMKATQIQTPVPAGYIAIKLEGGQSGGYRVTHTHPTLIPTADIYYVGQGWTAEDHAGCVINTITAPQLKSQKK